MTAGAHCAPLQFDAGVNTVCPLFYRFVQSLKLHEYVVLLSKIRHGVSFDIIEAYFEVQMITGGAACCAYIRDMLAARYTLSGNNMIA